MKCDVIIPVGPGHQEIYKQAMDSVRIACLQQGPFTEVKIKVSDDTEGKYGRSYARNVAVESSTADWLFFLDADDKMHPDAFLNMSPYAFNHDAIFGNIYEMQGGVVAWRYQVPYLDSYKQLIEFDPYVTLQMGHFVRRSVFKPFDEAMNTGEDWKYYLELWQRPSASRLESR